jgi:hypothetical protein
MAKYPNKVNLKYPYPYPNIHIQTKGSKHQEFQHVIVAVL